MVISIMNEKQTEADKMDNPSLRTKWNGTPPEAEEDAGSSEYKLDELLGRFDQIDALMVKGMDLAEVGLTLGVRLATRLSTALQLQSGDLFDRDKPTRPYSDMRTVPSAGPGVTAEPAYQREPERPAPPQAPAQFNYIMNRSPLYPGNPVRVSFTINNDSQSSPRELRLSVEGFVGVTHGARLDGNAFAIEPATRVVAPMDFDKFTLTGIIPPDAVPDAYDGWVVVSAEEGLRIPLRLIVTAIA